MGIPKNQTYDGPVQVVFNNNKLRKLYSDLKLKNKQLLEENKYLRTRQTKLLEEQNNLIRAALVTMDAKSQDSRMPRNPATIVQNGSL